MSNRKRTKGHAAPPPRVLLALQVTGEPGTDGEVRLHSKYDRPTTAAMLRRIADRFELGIGENGPEQPPAAGEDTTR